MHKFEKLVWQEAAVSPLLTGSRHERGKVALAGAGRYLHINGKLDILTGCGNAEPARSYIKCIYPSVPNPIALIPSTARFGMSSSGLIRVVRTKMRGKRILHHSFSWRKMQQDAY